MFNNLFSKNIISNEEIIKFFFLKRKNLSLVQFITFKKYYWSLNIPKVENINLSNFAKIFIFN